jgi:hypothetical protein
VEISEQDSDTVKASLRKSNVILALRQMVYVRIRKITKTKTRGSLVLQTWRSESVSRIGTE